MIYLSNISFLIYIIPLQSSQFITTLHLLISTIYQKSIFLVCTANTLSTTIAVYSNSNQSRFHVNPLLNYINSYPVLTSKFSVEIVALREEIFVVQTILFPTAAN